MATMNFSIPDDVKETFNSVFARRNKSAVITELMREAIDREWRRLAHMQAMKDIERLRADDGDDIQTALIRRPNRLYP
ncbi:MAG: hypothetical protein ABJB01_14115 [Rudaea sp.]